MRIDADQVDLWAFLRGTVLLIINRGGKNPVYCGRHQFLGRGCCAVYQAYRKCIKTSVFQFSSGPERHGHSVQVTGNDHVQLADSSFESLDSSCDDISQCKATTKDGEGYVKKT